MDHSTSENDAFAHRAARCSWICTVTVFVFLKLVPQGASQIIADLMALFLIVVGLGAGILALFGIREHGTARILKPALLGILLNGLLLTIFVTNFSAARARAIEQRNAASPRTSFHSTSR